MVTVTRKCYATLRHPKMYPHTKFGIPTSKNIGDMDQTRKRDRHTDGRTVRLLYASQSSFGGIKTIFINKITGNSLLHPSVMFHDVIPNSTEDIVRTLILNADFNPREILQYLS